MACGGGIVPFAFLQAQIALEKRGSKPVRRLWRERRRLGRRWSGPWRIGSRKRLAADLQACRGLCRAVVAQVAQDFLLFARVLTRQPRERIGNDVAVVQVGHGRIASHVQP